MSRVAGWPPRWLTPAPAPLDGRLAVLRARARRWAQRGRCRRPGWPFTDGASFIRDIPPHTRAVWGDDTSPAEDGMDRPKSPQGSNTHSRNAMAAAAATASPPSHSRLRDRQSRSTAWLLPCSMRRREAAGPGHRWRPATEKSHRALVSHATTTAVSSSAPVAGSAHRGSPRVWTKSTLAAKAP